MYFPEECFEIATEILANAENSIPADERQGKSLAWHERFCRHHRDTDQRTHLRAHEAVMVELSNKDLLCSCRRSFDTPLADLIGADPVPAATAKQHVVFVLPDISRRNHAAHGKSLAMDLVQDDSNPREAGCSSLPVHVTGSAQRPG